MTSTTAGPSGSDTAAACMDDVDCTDGAAPFCVGGQCIPCDEAPDPDAICAQADASSPLCAAHGFDDGIAGCVQCTPAQPDECGGTTPICDAQSFACRACSDHPECIDSGAGEACQRFDGSCIQDILFVDGDASCPGTGSSSMPLCSISDAVDAIPNGDASVIRIAEASTSYNEAVVVDAGKVVAFLANDGDSPRWRTNGDPTLRVAGGTSVALLSDIRLRDGTEVGLEVDAAQVWVDRCRIVQNDGGGIVASNNANLVVHSSFVGQGNPDTIAIEATDSTLDVLYSTLLGGSTVVESPAALACDTGSDVTVRNSFLVSASTDPELTCAGADVTYTASETAISGTGNQALGNLTGDWFADFADGDYLLDIPPAALLTTAQWQTGDPTTDIDGDARPTVDGSDDVAGADIP